MAAHSAAHDPKVAARVRRRSALKRPVGGSL